jgi:hypothetical protein
MRTEIKVGDWVEVTYQDTHVDPKVGERGKVVSLMNGYPRIKLDSSQGYHEELKHLPILDPLSLKIIKTNEK